LCEEIALIKSALIFLAAIILFWGGIGGTDSHGGVLHADFRPRPPEMVVHEENFSGPLKEILEEAASQTGYSIDWRHVPFPRSLHRLRQGATDIVPRTIFDEQRVSYIAYLGPIGYQQKDILFIVRKGREGLLRTYDDLYKYNIGVKRDTAYFPTFNQDAQIKKVLVHDDKNLALMFAGGRFDVIAVLDKTSLEIEFAENNYSDYAYAEFKFAQKIGNYYGMSKKSVNFALYPQLNKALQKMASSGRVAEIYRKHGIEPPLQ
jgi:polar amino acid transport system substrate-binding protein